MYIYEKALKKLIEDMCIHAHILKYEDKKYFCIKTDNIHIKNPNNKFNLIVKIPQIYIPIHTVNDTYSEETYECVDLNDIKTMFDMDSNVLIMNSQFYLSDSSPTGSIEIKRYSHFLDTIDYTKINEYYGCNMKSFTIPISMRKLLNSEKFYEFKNLLVNRYITEIIYYYNNKFKII